MYAESPLLSHDTDLYENNFLQRYGMLKWQVCWTDYKLCQLKNGSVLLLNDAPLIITVLVAYFERLRAQSNG